MSDFKAFPRRLDGMRRYSQAGDRAPHKPMVALSAPAKVQHGQDRIVFSECEATVARIMARVWNPTAQTVEQPFVRLRQDGFWKLDFGLAEAATPGESRALRSCGRWLRAQASTLRRLRCSARIGVGFPGLRASCSSRLESMKVRSASPAT
jgi:hypothetical protein